MSSVNGLTEAQEERLHLLVEECSEVIKEAMKILRFGYASYHPNDPLVTNLTLLQKELGDLEASITLMTVNDDIDHDIVFVESTKKYAKYPTSRFLKQNHKFFRN